MGIACLMRSSFVLRDAFKLVFSIDDHYDVLDAVLLQPNTIMSNLADTQRAFVHQYMDDENVVGVRVRKLEDQFVLFVEVGKAAATDMPEVFGDLPVVVREGHRAQLAYA